jgi:serine protease Do
MTKTIKGIISFFTVALSFVVVAAQAQAQTQAVQLPNFVDLVEKHGPAVVNVSTQTRGGSSIQHLPGLSEDDPWSEFFRRFMPPEARPGPAPRQGPQSPRGGERQPPLRPFGAGSGFIVSSDGYVLTNAHVVDNADEVTVTLTDKRDFKAKVIGVDKRTDVAVLKIDATNLPKVTIGSSDKLRVGEWVLAVGSPFGLTNSVSAGIVSAKGRDEVDRGGVAFIQTDVAVNPGNSGGPLFNLKGEVVGINSQILSRTGGYQGISFAIPIDDALRVSEQIIKTGRVSRGRLGVLIGNLTREAAEALGLPKAQGASVQNVEKDSPAEKAGVQAGDIVLKVDGRSIEGSAELTRVIGNTKPGSRVTLNVWRSGSARDISVTVGEFKDEKSETPKVKAGKSKAEATPGKLGIAVSDLNAEQKKDLKLAGGVLVEVAQGAAAMVVQAGDIIMRVNNTDITSAKQFSDIVAKLDLKRPVALLIRNEDGSRFVTFRPDGE